jgi:RNA polymerase sigma factor (sigma-70 family)
MEAVLTGKLERAYKNESKKLLGFIRSKISSIEDAEDILHDVFLSAVNNINITEPIDNLAGWIYTIARNRIIDWYRKKKNRTVSLHQIKNDISLEEMIQDAGINLEKQMLRKIVMQAIEESLEELPESQREVFFLQAIEGKTFKEISEITKTPVNTLLARKRYAVLFLRDRLREIKEMIDEEV